MNNVQLIVDNYLCSACGACSVVCPKNAIYYESSTIGRKYACVDLKRCIECGLCIKACPSSNMKSLSQAIDAKSKENIRGIYVGRATDNFVYANSQSGGGCTAILSFLFETHNIDAAIVCKMSYNNPPRVEGCVVSDIKQLVSCQKSCYTPVDVLTALKKCENKKSIAIVGLPCHIEGGFLLKENFSKYRNINYLIGLICDRTLCAGIMDVFLPTKKNKKYLIEWRKKDFIYNNKYYPYKAAPIVVRDENNNLKVISSYKRFVLKEMFTPPRCRVCKDKMNYYADIVCGDPWGMTNIDWNKGETLMIARSPKGQKVIEECFKKGFIVIEKRNNIDEISEGQFLKDKVKSQHNYVSALYNICCNSVVLEFAMGKLNVGATIAKERDSLLSYLKTEQLSQKAIKRKARTLIMQENLYRRKYLRYIYIVIVKANIQLKKFSLK